jgi:hypothetical protein
MALDLYQLELALLVSNHKKPNHSVMLPNHHKIDIQMINPNHIIYR